MSISVPQWWREALGTALYSNIFINLFRPLWCNRSTFYSTNLFGSRNFWQLKLFLALLHQLLQLPSFSEMRSEFLFSNTFCSHQYCIFLAPERNLFSRLGQICLINKLLLWLL